MVAIVGGGQLLLAGSDPFLFVCFLVFDLQPDHGITKVEDPQPLLDKGVSSALDAICVVRILFSIFSV